MFSIGSTYLFPTVTKYIFQRSHLQYTEFHSIICGIIHGSVLGPTLFNLKFQRYSSYSTHSILPFMRTTPLYSRMCITHSFCLKIFNTILTSTLCGAMYGTLRLTKAKQLLSIFLVNFPTLIDSLLTILLSFGLIMLNIQGLLLINALLFENNSLASVVKLLGFLNPFHPLFVAPRSLFAIKCLFIMHASSPKLLMPVELHKLNQYGFFFRSNNKQNP